MPAPQSSLTAQPGLPAITLVYFSCVGREHLLARTAEAMERFNRFAFAAKILAFDGPLDREFSVADLGITKLVNNVVRAGYVPSVQNVLPLIDTPYFFWQEDDCRYVRDIDVASLLGELEANPRWSQIGWGIGEKFPDDEKVRPLGRDNLYETAYGFSARPSLCRTQDLREAFAMREGDAIETKDQNIEVYLRNWLKLKAKLSVSIDPGEEAIYLHEGQLESTNREFHFMKPVKEYRAETYVSSLGFKSVPPFWRRIKLCLDLLVSMFWLAASQLFVRRRYDVAWRVVRLERGTRR